jgi:hypothetical protein
MGSVTWCAIFCMCLVSLRRAPLPWRACKLEDGIRSIRLIAECLIDSKDISIICVD